MVLDQHIKNPSKLKTGLEGHSFKRDNTAHQKHRFFYSVGLYNKFLLVSMRSNTAHNKRLNLLL